MPQIPKKWEELKLTKLLEHAVETVRGLAPDIQNQLASLLLQFAGEELPVSLTSAKEEASFEESLAQEALGEFASDAQVSAIWAKHRL